MTPAVEKVARQSSPAGAARPVPPEWAIERVIKAIGRVPGAAGRFLDRLAKAPVLGFVVRRFSSVWFGIILLALIGTYIAIGSGMSWIREGMEMTDLQFFDWYPMRILLVCLVVDLTFVTLRRIPLTLFKLGSWTVHVGIVTLIGGSVWYFSQKVEGSVRLYLNHGVTHYYDVTERALYAFDQKPDGTFDTAHPTITALPTLPIFFEHLPDNGNPVDITLGHALPGSDASVHISSYYPAAFIGDGPAVAVGLTAGPDRIPGRWLFADSPADRVLEGDFPFGIEFLHHPDAARVRELQSSFDGPLGLTVRIPKLNIERTYAVKPGQVIAVEGSPYTLTAGDVSTIPMLSKGYENAFSTAMMVDVERRDGTADFKFQRSCLSRYPERSPDFVEENGKRVRKQDGVDPGIQIVFQDATQTQVWVIENADGTLSLITRTGGTGGAGKSTTQALDDKPVEIPVEEIKLGPLQLRILDRTEDAATSMTPEIEPPERRRKGQQVMEVIEYSIIGLEVAQGSWQQGNIYVPFAPYAEVGRRPNGVPPTVVKLPDGRKVGFLLSTVLRPLPSTLTLTKFEPIKYPGATRAYADFKSTLTSDDGGGTARVLQPHLNNPAADHGYYYFQSAWDGDDNAAPDRRFSVIGVGNRPGIYVMLTGAILIALGIGYAFYVKPLLLKAKKQALANWAAERGKAAPASG